MEKSRNLFYGGSYSAIKIREINQPQFTIRVHGNHIETSLDFNYVKPCLDLIKL